MLPFDWALLGMGGCACILVGQGRVDCGTWLGWVGVALEVLPDRGESIVALGRHRVAYGT